MTGNTFGSGRGGINITSGPSGIRIVGCTVGCPVCGGPMPPIDEYVVDYEVNVNTCSHDCAVTNWRMRHGGSP